MKSKPAKTVKASDRVLLVQTSDKKEMKITLPPSARVTFGPTIPYRGKDNYSGTNGGYSLRVYESKDKDSLAACFCDVVSFRDLSIPCAKLVLREAGKTLWKSDEEGFKVEQEVKVERTFEDQVKQLV